MIHRKILLYLFMSLFFFTGYAKEVELNNNSSLLGSWKGNDFVKLVAGNYRFQKLHFINDHQASYILENKSNKRSINKTDLDLIYKLQGNTIYYLEKSMAMAYIKAMGKGKALELFQTMKILKLTKDTLVIEYYNKVMTLHKQ